MRPPTAVRPALLAVFLAALAANTIIAVILPSRPDEITWYQPVVEESARVWPELNTTVVGQGVSPIYAWIMGGLVSLGLPPVLMGRLLSLVAAASSVILLARRHGLVAGLPLLIFPVAVFAARLHPLWPAIALMVVAFTVKKSWVKPLAVLMSCNLQPVMAPLVVGVWIDQFIAATPRQPLRWLLWGAIFAVAAGVGVVSTWLLYGAQYTDEFVAQFPELSSFSGFTPAYAPLVVASAGVAALIVRPALSRLTIRRLLLAVGLAIAAGVAGLLSPIPVGPLGRVLDALPLSNVLYALVIAVGAFLLVEMLTQVWSLGASGRWHVVALVGVLAAAVLVLGRLPWLYERYAFFVVGPAFALVFARMPRPEWRRYIVVGAGLVLGAVGLSLYGSL